MSIADRWQTSCLQFVQIWLKALPTWVIKHTHIILKKYHIVTTRTTKMETKMVKFGTMEMKRALALTMVTMFFGFWWQLFFDIDNGDNGCWCPCNLQTCPGIGGLNLKWMQAGLCEPPIWRKVIIVVRGHQNFFNDIWSYGQRQPDMEFVECFTQARFPKF